MAAFKTLTPASALDDARMAVDEDGLTSEDREGAARYRATAGSRLLTEEDRREADRALARRRQRLAG
jgi:hypothetical protein